MAETMYIRIVVNAMDKPELGVVWFVLRKLKNDTRIWFLCKCFSFCRKLNVYTTAKIFAVCIFSSQKNVVKYLSAKIGRTGKCIDLGRFVNGK